MYDRRAATLTAPLSWATRGDLVAGEAAEAEGLLHVLHVRQRLDATTSNFGSRFVDFLRGDFSGFFDESALGDGGIGAVIDRVTLGQGELSELFDTVFLHDGTGNLYAASGLLRSRNFQRYSCSKIKNQY